MLNMCIELHLGPENGCQEIIIRLIDSISYEHSSHWLTSCNLNCTCPLEARPGFHLNISFGYTSVMPLAAPKKKRSLLPLLTVLFLFSYGLMTVLIVEQGSAIQAQRNLIKVLMRDSTELWAAKGKAIGDQQVAQAQAKENIRANTPSTQTPSTQAQTPSSQVPATQIPSTQATPQHRSQSHAGKIAKPNTEVPPVPASDLVDRRRALSTI
jgi:hypothetical protein